MVINDRPLPHVEWVEGWPTDEKTPAIAPPIILAAIFGALAITPVVGAPWSDGLVVVVGAAGMIMAFLGFSYAFVMQLPRTYFPRRSSGVRTSVDGQYGAGVRLALDRRELARFIPAMAGLSVYGFCGWLDWRGGGGSLLPVSKSHGGGATVALVFSSVLAFFVVFFSILPRWMIRTGIHPSGITRRVPVMFGRTRFDFIPWSAIAEFTAGRYSSGKARDLPTIKVHLEDESAPPANKLIDEPGILTIPAYSYRCDKNALLSILVFLKSNPDKTSLLADPGISKWFIQVERCGRRVRRDRKIEGGKS